MSVVNAKKKAELKLRKKAKKKNRKQRQQQEEIRKADLENEDVDVEYIAQPADIDTLRNISGMSSLDDISLQHFSDIFKHFQIDKPQEYPALDVILPEAESVDEQSDLHLSKKKMKKAQRLTVTELKQLVKKPECVEWWDTTAADPKLFVSLKSCRNTVPVPAHWNQKRKYLQGKRRIEKPPFELPDFIKDTGIMEMRDALKEKEKAAGLKSKMKEKARPKLGKLNMDYQKLHDAFFKFQKPCKYTLFGELYFEGKEFETKIEEQKPGQLSEVLRQALNMAPLTPPPWLIHMQRYGPPPSYPDLKIPGLNAPIPKGAQWGYQPGGWGRPPVDEYNRPLYGDVFGVVQPAAATPEIIEPIDAQLWGELEEEEDDYDEVEEDEEESAEEEAQNTEAVADDLASGSATPSDIASGLEIPDYIELRKDRKRDDDDDPKQLYQVLPKVQKNISGFMGSQHGYDVTTLNKPKIAQIAGGIYSKRTVDNVDVAFDPSELENGLDEATLHAKYNEQMKAKLPSRTGDEDLSDMYAEHAIKQAKRAKIQDKIKQAKKKEFKF